MKDAKNANLRNCFSDKAKRLWNYFTTYERTWLLVFSLIAIVCSIILPEDSSRSIFGTTLDGTLITVFVVVSTIIGLLAEILASKQSKWHAFIYIFVEILEIIRFLLVIAWTQMLVCLLFWLPIHIITFINWQKHEDKAEKEKTIVRALKPKYVVMLISGVVVWTLVFGYLFAYLTEGMNLFTTELSQAISPYLDACASALAIANGILLYFRYTESWIVWIIYSIVCIPFYILNGWYVFIVLQLGYLTNAIYGYVTWKKYTKNKADKNQKNEETKENYKQSELTEDKENQHP